VVKTPQTAFAAIKVMAAGGCPVQVARRTLQVSESGYYAARVAAPSERTIRYAWLTDVIVKIHADSRETYGTRRVHAELASVTGSPSGTSK
jgi:putative transposase